MKSPCLVALPPAWQQAKRRGVLWRGVWDQHGTAAPLADGSGVLADVDQGRVAHMLILGRGHRVTHVVGDVPNPFRQLDPPDPFKTGQIAFNTAHGKYLAFIYAPLNGDAASFNWQLYLWHETTGRLLKVASNPVDSHGQPLPGGWVQPVLTDTDLFWIQATPWTNGWGGSELMRYSLTSGQITRLYRGLVMAFVPYGDQVLFTGLKRGTPHADPNSTQPPPMAMYSVDLHTGAIIDGPLGMTAAHDQPNYMIASGDVVVWATDLTMRAWSPAWGRSITLVPYAYGWPTGTRLGLTGVSGLGVYRRFVLWDGGGGTYVLDLTRNTFARVMGGVGSNALTGTTLSLQRQPHPNYGRNHHQAPRIEFDQWLMDLRGLPHLPRCSR